MCCFMGTVTMTYWSLSQKKVARNKHKKLGMRFRYSTCLNQISLNNLRKSTFSSMSVSASKYCLKFNSLLQVSQFMQ
jgi:putative hemolysin